MPCCENCCDNNTVKNEENNEIIAEGNIKKNQQYENGHLNNVGINKEIIDGNLNDLVNDSFKEKEEGCLDICGNVAATINCERHENIERFCLEKELFDIKNKVNQSEILFNLFQKEGTFVFSEKDGLEGFEKILKVKDFDIKFDENDTFLLLNNNTVVQFPQQENNWVTKNLMDFYVKKIIALQEEMLNYQSKAEEIKEKIDALYALQNDKISNNQLNAEEKQKEEIIALQKEMLNYQSKAEEIEEKITKMDYKVDDFMRCWNYSITSQEQAEKQKMLSGKKITFIGSPITIYSHQSINNSNNNNSNYNSSEYNENYDENNKFNNYNSYNNENYNENNNNNQNYKNHKNAQEITEKIIEKVFNNNYQQQNYSNNNEFENQNNNNLSNSNSNNSQYNNNQNNYHDFYNNYNHQNPQNSNKIINNDNNHLSDEVDY